MAGRDFHPESVKSILVVRLYFVGDVLLCTPVLEGLKRAFPDASLTVLVKKRGREVLEGNPFVDQVVEYDATANYHSPRWMASLALRLRRARFDLSVDLTGDLRSSWLLFAADPGFRVGVNHAGLGFLLDRRVPYKCEGHVVDHLLKAVESVGVTRDDPVPKLYLTADECAAAGALLSGLGIAGDAPFVVLSPGASWEYKRWPRDRFARLASLISSELGLPSVVTGSEADADAAQEIVEGSGGAALSLAGKTTLREFAGVAGRARAFVGNDSGPMHVAASQGTPVVALFGPGAPERFVPRGAPSQVIWPGFPCSPCSQKRCQRPGDTCMGAIEVGQVLEALRSLLAETPGGRGGSLGART